MPGSHIVESPEAEPEESAPPAPHSPSDGRVLPPSIRKRTIVHGPDPERDVTDVGGNQRRKSRMATILQPKKKIGPAPGVIQSLKAVLLASCTDPVFRNSITLKGILFAQGSIFYFYAFQPRLVLVRLASFSLL